LWKTASAKLLGLYHFPRSGKLIEPQRRRGERNDLGE
jgi:hypothetical protein